MAFKRIKGFIIDFIVIILMFNIINLIIPEHDDVKVLKAEQNEILEDYTSHRIGFDKYFVSYSKVNHSLAKKELVNNLVYLVCMISYFIILPYFWKGRTLGCFFNSIQIERFDQGKLKWYQLFIRQSIVFGITYLIISNICILLPSKYYFLVVSIVGILQIVIALFSANMIAFTKEKRGIQDLLSNTEIAKIIKIKN